MDLGLAGKVAVVTGASKGIGLAIVTALAAEGATVVAGARTIGSELNALAENGSVTAVSVDLSTTDGPAALVAVAEKLGGVDILVNNVGALTTHSEGFGSITDEHWAASLNLNLMTPVRTTRAALPSMVARGGGCVVTISSVNAFLPDPFIIEYGAAKAALTNFSKALSKEVGPQGIRMNTISPGPVETPLWFGENGVAASVAAANGIDIDTAREQIVQSQGGFSTGRFTRPDEIADLVLYLAGDRAANITGSDFVIDGGLIKTL